MHNFLAMLMFISMVCAIFENHGVKKGENLVPFIAV